MTTYGTMNSTTERAGVALTTRPMATEVEVPMHDERTDECRCEPWDRSPARRDEGGWYCEACGNDTELTHAERRVLVAVVQAIRTEGRRRKFAPGYWFLQAAAFVEELTSRERGRE